MKNEKIINKILNKNQKTIKPYGQSNKFQLSHQYELL